METPTPASSATLGFSSQQRDLLRDLFAAGCVIIGDEVQSRFGLGSPIYINMRENLYARPELLWRVGGEFAWKIVELASPPLLPAGKLASESMAASMGVPLHVAEPRKPEPADASASGASAAPAPQIVVGIPDTATPLALTAALYSWGNRTRPQITFALLRKEAKRYPGHQPSFWIGPHPGRMVGAANAEVDATSGETTKSGAGDSSTSAKGGSDAPKPEYNLIDDVVASGLTKRTAAVKMRAEGIPLTRIVVFFDRGQGDGLREEGFNLHSIYNLREVVDFYAAEGLVTPAEHERIAEFLAHRRFDRNTA
jgi:orotate phosphoribosyltransferase